MRRNPARRTALVDAAITVLARDGARGLTFRAVDTEAGVPAGTASNYFPSRDDLLTHAGRQVHERLGPGASELEAAYAAEPTRELVVELMHALLRRIQADRTGYLALLELRLEATRRPDLQETLTDTLRANLADNVRINDELGLPGGEHAVVVLYFTLSGLFVEYLTTPGVLSPHRVEDLVTMVIDRVLPSPPPPGSTAS